MSLCPLSRARPSALLGRLQVLLFSSRGEVSGAGVWPVPLEPSPDELPRIASLLLPAVPWRPRSESPCEVRDGAQSGCWASRSQRKDPSSKPSVQPRARGSPPRPQAQGRLQRLLHVWLWGELCRMWIGMFWRSTTRWRGSGEALDQSSGSSILKEDWETQALDLPSLKERRTHEPYLQENPSLRGEEESQARSSGGP